MRKLMRNVSLCLAVAGLAAVQAATIQLQAAGATFPAPIYTKWFDAYNKLHPDVQVNYQPIGSGGGIRQLIAKTVDFGASDGPMTDDQLKQAPVKILHFPTVLGAVVPSYNIDGVSTSLKFTGKALAGIFLGTINKWNDPEIVKTNPGVKLPAEDIVVIHRAEASGTTYIWTDFLSKVSPEWKAKTGGANASINWPTGLGGPKSEGVAGLLKQTPNSIGYIELTYAIQNGILFGDVQNSAGVFVKATLASVSAAAAGAAKDMPEDFRVSITDAPGKDAYPISSFTWLLVPAKIQDASKRDMIKGFLGWMLKDGQGYCEGLAYGKLPPAVVAKETKQIAQIQ